LLPRAVSLLEKGPSLKEIKYLYLNLEDVLEDGWKEQGQVAGWFSESQDNGPDRVLQASLSHPSPESSESTSFTRWEIILQRLVDMIIFQSSTQAATTL